MGKGFLATTDTGLLQWANGFSTQINATPEAFGISVELASGYASSLASYSSALAAARSENTRTRGAVAQKNSTKLALRQASMALAAVARSHPGVTSQQLKDLGLTVPDRKYSASAPPAEAPVITLLSVTGRTAFYKLSDATAPSSKRRPISAEGAVILSCTGATPPPPDEAGWKLESQTGRTRFAVRFDDSVAPGTPCWVTARWYSRRGAYSPAAAAVQTYLQIGPVHQAG